MTMVEILILTDLPELVLFDRGGVQTISLLSKEKIDGCFWLTAPFPGVEALRHLSVRDVFTQPGVTAHFGTPDELLAGESSLPVDKNLISEDWLPNIGWKLPAWVQFPSWANS